MHGVSFSNLILAEQSNNDDRQDEYRERMNDWWVIIAKAMTIYGLEPQAVLGDRLQGKSSNQCASETVYRAVDCNRAVGDITYWCHG